MALTGTASGSSRNDLNEKAREIAATYFGTKCVTADLSNEIVEHEMNTGDGYAVVTTFSASFTADVEHRWDVPAYGFAKCRYCGKTASR